MNSPQFNLCTISFRHELTSFPELIRFASETGFSGIELWGVHANAYIDRYGARLNDLLNDLGREKLRISMISHYISRIGEVGADGHILRQGSKLIRHARSFQTEKIRIFAGNIGSAGASEEIWRQSVKQIRALSGLCQEFGIRLVIETHPGTLADTLASTQRLLHEVDHESLGINLDLLHVWEAGEDPLQAAADLRTRTVCYHLKNVSHREELSVFEPSNVYSPSGSREGIVALGQGAVDYRAALRHMIELCGPLSFSASVEWFGERPFAYLAEEMGWLQDAIVCQKGAV